MGRKKVALSLAQLLYQDVLYVELLETDREVVLNHLGLELGAPSLAPSFALVFSKPMH